MAASGVNDHLPYQNDFDIPYTGSIGGQNGSVRGELVQPVFLFVDLQTTFKVGRGGAPATGSIAVWCTRKARDGC